MSFLYLFSNIGALNCSLLLLVLLKTFPVSRRERNQMKFPSRTGPLIPDVIKCDNFLVFESSWSSLCVAGDWSLKVWDSLVTVATTTPAWTPPTQVSLSLMNFSSIRTSILISSSHHYSPHNLKCLQTRVK